MTFEKDRNKTFNDLIFTKKQDCGSTAQQIVAKKRRRKRGETAHLVRTIGSIPVDSPCFLRRFSSVRKSAFTDYCIKSFPLAEIWKFERILLKLIVLLHEIDTK
ncbi:hypothetical protein B9Z55_001595 [Caenorhabditis nigoni]|uniref:Uncharacterized protein n=1 Tax=Caenorhabditis nigoni TaxID=1611254 RepID=A0A2G5VGG1_9PELO|nr:hypothetical protein B9Z55_001595 [Caenorhabditis nigoni]